MLHPVLYKYVDFGFWGVVNMSGGVSFVTRVTAQWGCCTVIDLFGLKCNVERNSSRSV